MINREYDIRKVASSLGLSEEDIIPFGYDKCKIDTDRVGVNLPKKGKIILCTAITPTKAGEGKTTTAIGLADGLKEIGANVLACLREPSLGPVFGVKGGGAGGGEATLYPEEDINLHFTGDLHAITSLHNLIAALIDNELYQHSELDVDPDKIIFPHTMDMNDRSLRDIIVANNDPKTVPHKSSFVITAASEVMAIFCLSKDEEDFLDKIESITVAYNKNGEPIFARDLKSREAFRKLIHTALYPNLVQTKYHTPAIVHGGPFANIAHGTNTIIATNLSLKLADYICTEAGFGSDLGMEKYLDIVSPLAGFNPSLIVMVVTARALKLHGGVKFENLTHSDPEAVKRGLPNLRKHLDNVKLYNIPTLVSINRFKDDSDEEIEAIEEYLKENGFDFALNTSYLDGPKGAVALAKEAKRIVDSIEENKFAPIVNPSMSIKEKIETISKCIYGAKDVVYSDEANKLIEEYIARGYSDYNICISKTPNSLSDDMHLLNVPEHTIHVRTLRLFTGARFIVPLTGDVFTMPGLPKVPASKKMSVK